MILAGATRVESDGSACHPLRVRLRDRARTRQRGITLIEALVTLAIGALVVGMSYFALGTLDRTRLNSSAILVSGAIRAAYNHANASSRPTRVVLDFGEGEGGKPRVSIEDSSGRMFLQSGDRTGGAAAADELEAEILSESDDILAGVRAPRAHFTPVKNLLGFEHQDKAGASKDLEDGIYFTQIEVDHEPGPVTEGRAYIYFFPGGQTERAAIQLQKGKDDIDEDDIMTLVVSPLTGKVDILSGPVEMPRPRSEEEASERSDSGF